MNKDILTASSATLFYKADRDSILADFLRTYTDKSFKNGVTLEIVINKDKILLHKLRFAPGNKVAKTILGIYNYLKNKYGASIRNDSRVDALLNAEYSIGLVFEPDLRDDDKRLDFFVKLTDLTLGVVFNGDTLFDSSFEPLQPLS